MWQKARFPIACGTEKTAKLNYCVEKLAAPAVLLVRFAVFYFLKNCDKSLQNGAFPKRRSSNRRNLKTPAFRFHSERETSVVKTELF